MLEVELDDLDSGLAPGQYAAFYIDYDSDGYGSADYTTTACDVPDDYTTDATDCDDLDADLNPMDLDGDGESSCEGDCRDEDDRFTSISCPAFIEIEGGTFRMGSPESEPGRDEDELQHGVTLSHDFELMSTEVTQGLYSLLMGNNPSDFLDCGSDCPVENVNWHSAAAAANKFSELEGLPPCYDCEAGGSIYSCISPEDPYACEGYRLPTEAEWEYAARFGTEKSFWTPRGGGDLDDDFATSCDMAETVLDDGTQLTDLAWFCANNLDVGNDGNGTKPVAQLVPNGHGLFDMHGNVYEWVHDGYEEYPDSNVTDPKGDDGNVNKVLRGGRWSLHGKEMRCAEREVQSSTLVYNFLGFRMARTVR